MVTFEEVCKKIFTDPRILVKLLIGGIIMFIPVINLAALGYVRLYLTQIRQSGDFALPEWKENPAKLFMEGVYFLVVLVLFGLVPLLATWFLCGLINVLTGGLMTLLAMVWISPVLLVIPALAAAANYRMGSEFDWRSLSEVRVVFGMVAATWRTLLVPSLAFWGLCLLFLPAYGFAFFIGGLTFFAYATLVFVYLEKRGTDLV